ncbi:MAG: MotA/TolQ/ExbB proton channel family protein [Myxococcota bacterium]
MVSLGLVAAWLVVALVGAVAPALWTRRLLKGRKNLPRWLKVLVGVLAASTLFGALGAIVGLVKAFGAVGGESVDPSQKARILAEGISEAMNCTTFALLVGLPSVVVLVVLMKRYPKHAP